MAKKLSLDQKKEYAKTLYVHQRLTQKDAAEKAGVSAKTMNEWVHKFGWETLRVSLILTKEQQLHRIYAQINELNTRIEDRAEGERYADSKEADTLVKLTSAAKDLEADMGISEVIEVGKKFTDHLKSFDIAKAQEITKLFDAFIVTLL